MNTLVLILARIVNSASSPKATTAAEMKVCDVPLALLEEARQVLTFHQENGLKEVQHAIARDWRGSHEH